MCPCEPSSFCLDPAYRLRNPLNIIIQQLIVNPVGHRMTKLQILNLPCL